MSVSSFALKAGLFACMDHANFNILLGLTDIKKSTGQILSKLHNVAFCLNLFIPINISNKYKHVP